MKELKKENKKNFLMKEKSFDKKKEMNFFINVRKK